MPARKPVSKGQIFDRLTVISDGNHVADRSGHITYMSIVRCICGIEFEVRQGSLRNGNSTSCGCKNKERAKGGLNFKHNHCYSGVYDSWRSMKARCLNAAKSRFHHWGGRGIGICDRWLIFDNFLQDMGERPVGMSLDRIDNDGNYEPGNCRWADDATQAFNQAKTQRVIYNGRAVSFSQACREIGRSTATIREFQIDRGLTHQQAIDQYHKRRWANSATT